MDFLNGMTYTVSRPVAVNKTVPLASVAMRTLVLRRHGTRNNHKLLVTQMDGMGHGINLPPSHLGPDHPSHCLPLESSHTQSTAFRRPGALVPLPSAALRVPHFPGLPSP
jgi:hypothetical protein